MSNLNSETVEQLVIEPDTTLRSAGVRKGTSSFAGGVFALSGGAAVAQAVAILAAPITSRLFAPEAFGLAALFTSFVAIFTIVSCLRYESAVILPAKDRDAANILGLCCVLIIASSLLALGMVACCGQQLLGVLHASELESYMWLFPLGVFASGVALPLRYWNSRHRRFKQLGVIKATSGVSGTAACVGVGFAGYTSGSNLIAAKLLMPISDAAILGWYVLRHDLPFILKHCRIPAMWRMSARYVKFPLFSSWSNLLNVTYYQTPPILLAAFFGTAVAGLYSRVMALFGIPMILLGQAVSQVFFQQAAAKRGRGESLSELVEGLCQRLMALVILPLLIVALIGKDIFAVVLGARWAEAGVYAMILVPWMFSIFLTGSVTTLFDIFELQGRELLFNILFLTTGAGSLVLGGLFLKDAKSTLLLFSITMALAYTLRAHYMLSVAGVSLRQIVLSLRGYFVNAGPVLILVVIARWWIKLPSAWVLFTAAVTSIPYYVYLLRRDKQLRQVLRSLIKKV